MREASKTGCACLAADAWGCIEARYGSNQDGDECMCVCHEGCGCGGVDACCECAGTGAPAWADDTDLAERVERHRAEMAARARGHRP